MCNLDAMTSLQCFPWCHDTTSSAFDADRYRQFLASHGVLGHGLWARETDPDGTLHRYGELPVDDNPFVLPAEGAALEQATSVISASLTRGIDVTDGTAAVDVKQVAFTMWQDYYSWRDFSTVSPVCILLQWPLTLYHVINCLRHDYPDMASLVTHTGRCTVHIVGAAKEADLTPAFFEVGMLLPHLVFDLHLIGPAISPRASGLSQTRHNVTVTLHRGLYHDVATSLPAPNVVIGFNAGLAAYTNWLPTLQLIQRHRYAAYFTDYCLQSYEFTCQQCNTMDVVRLSMPVINPFHSPIRVHDETDNTPRYSNAVLFHIKY